MSRLTGAAVGLVVGYLIGMGVGASFVALMSTNTHDKSLELAMTSLVVAGPIGAAVGLVAGLIKGGSRRRGET